MAVVDHVTKFVYRCRLNIHLKMWLLWCLVLLLAKAAQGVLLEVETYEPIPMYSVQVTISVIN